MSRSESRASRQTSAEVRVVAPRRGFDLGIAEAWRDRSLLYRLVERLLRLRYKQTVLGVGWAIAQPLLATGAFLILARFADLPTDGAPAGLFFLGGLVVWTFVTSGLTNCSTSLVENQSVITKVYFPRVHLPLAAVLASLTDLAVGTVLVATLTWVSGYGPDGRALLLIPAMVSASLTVAGPGLILASLNALYRDIKFLLPLATQFGLLASPVAYPLSAVPRGWSWVYGLNPAVAPIEIFRYGLGLSRGLMLGPVIASVGLSVALLIVGLAAFRALETQVVDRL